MQIKLLILCLGFSTSSFNQALRPGDGLQLVFDNINHPYSGDDDEQLDDQVQLPFIDLIYTENRDYKDIRAEIFKNYDALYKESELTVQSFLKVKTLGEVRDPGIYDISGIEKLSDLLALVADETDAADFRKIYFRQDGQRNTVDVQEVLKRGQMLADMAHKSGPQISTLKRWF